MSGDETGLQQLWGIASSRNGKANKCHSGFPHVPL